MDQSSKKFIYPDCNFVNDHGQHMKYHENRHADRKCFKCDRCNYTCGTRGMLESHMNSHEVLLRFRCDSCSYTSNHRSGLRAHLKTKIGHRAALDDSCTDNDKTEKTFINSKGRKRAHSYGNDQSLASTNLGPSGDNLCVPPAKVQKIEISPYLNDVEHNTTNEAREDISSFQQSGFIPTTDETQVKIEPESPECLRRQETDMQYDGMPLDLSTNNIKVVDDAKQRGNNTNRRARKGVPSKVIAAEAEY